MSFNRPLATFYSYSHKDRKHLERLRDAVAFLRIRHFLDEWDDREIRAGQQWKDAIIERARNSRVFLLLLTNQFMGSEFCIYTELVIARKLWEKKQAAIAPVLVEDANWNIPGLDDLQVIKPFGGPAKRSPTAWTEVGRQIQAVADALANGTYFQQTPAEQPEIPPLLPYTIGRDDAAARVCNAITAAQADTPMLCFLTGEGQGQAEFVAHLLSEEGPVRLALPIAGAIRQVELSAKDWALSGEPVERLLNEALASQLERPPAEVDRKSVARALPSPSGLTVVRTELSAAEWQLCGAGRLQDFAAYWTNWPETEAAGRIIVFAAIRADGVDAAIPGAFSLALPDVERGQVQAWLQRDDVRRRFLKNLVENDLDSVFNGRDRAPMEEFAPRIKPILRRLQG